MGDAVNLASRLEGVNKLYRTHILISKSTQEQAKNDVEARPLDFLRLKGKVQPVQVFELVARKGQLRETQKKGFALYEEALAFYRSRDFHKANAAFRKVLEVLPNDGPSTLYIERTDVYMVSPPAQDWDGVYVMTTK
jgi:adenylate cyclase